ncbi:hypothetical protein ACLQ2E_32395 [Streptomyces lavendulocolor]
MTEDLRGPRTGTAQTGQALQERGFAGSIRPEQPEYLTVPNVEAHSIQRSSISVMLGEAIEDCYGFMNSGFHTLSHIQQEINPCI